MPARYPDATPSHRPYPMTSPRPARTYQPAVGPRLKLLLGVVFGLFALLSVNALFLLAVRVAGQVTGRSYENLFYLYNFLGHLALGALIVVPVVVFGLAHIVNARNRPNRRAVKVGYALFATSLVLLGTGILLTRIEGIVQVNGATVRRGLWWAHVLTPVIAAWLFILHRLAGKKIRWRVGGAWALVGLVFAGASLLFMTRDPRQWNVVGNPSGEQYFFPSLARTLTGDFIPERVLMNDDYCLKCHEDVHEGWSASVHRFSSFNNPPYLASVRATRAAMLERDGDVNGSRFCAGCHDPVPFFSGKFDDPQYDDVNDPTAHAGITCTACHAITHVNSPRGNADYTIEEPIQYPFTFSDSPALRWINEQLVKAKPEFHKKTFLKPLHRTTEYCGTCHKVHLPVELNDYKWLRGQNHYDSFFLSGVSGQGVSSFYYPPQAETNCNGCHMKPIPSDDFAARVRDDSGERKTLDHFFPSANTALPVLEAELGRLSPERAAEAVRAHREFNEGAVRVDLFALREGGTIDGTLTAPLRPDVPALRPGDTYLLETVIRTLKLGHLLTQGTADSNELWLEVLVTSGGRVIGRSGGVDDSGAVDPWSHYVNSFVLDREGNRVARRNAEDIFVALYNHQIPPGAADTVHYRLTVPEDVAAPVEVRVALRYRKFDTEYMRFVRDDPTWVNDLPVLTLAEDRVVFPVDGLDADVTNPPFDAPLWQRWNDFGIGLLRKEGSGQLRQAEQAFLEVERLGRADGPVNLARVYVREGRIAHDAPDALRRARDIDPPAPEWSILWFTGLVHQQNGELDDAIRNFQQIVDGGFEQALGRGFDFSKDYRLLNELGATLYERARQERGDERAEARRALLDQARARFERVLELDPENATAHYSLKQAFTEFGDEARARHHAELHARYKPDDNATDLAIAAARRRYPAANHAAEAVVIYDLHRDGAPLGAVTEDDRE